jgi:hypothetical protein
MRNNLSLLASSHLQRRHEHILSEQTDLAAKLQGAATAGLQHQVLPGVFAAQPTPTVLQPHPLTNRPRQQHTCHHSHNAICFSHLTSTLHATASLDVCCVYTHALTQSNHAHNTL